ncbi:MAG: hypothetical protein IKO13_02695 [Oscillospiraceae bacterium]|nr:hypothetical protein [Oscillospiraceae bacterium]
MEPLHFPSVAAIGHAYLISSSARADAVRAAKMLAGAAVCLAGHDVPCGVCRGCRKAASGSHPDIIPVVRQTDRNGNLRRELTVDQIRELAADAQVLPNEAERKVYIIEEAELMNLNAQNAALKLLEEPPATVIFVLCAVNSNQLLETVRSRCLSLSVAGGEEAADEDSRKLADGFLTAVRSGDRIRLYRWLAKNELNKIDLTTDFIEASLQRTADMLCGRASCGNLMPEQQMQLYRLLLQCADYLKVNVNPKHIFSLLAAGALESSVPPHSGLSETGESE